MNSNKKFEDEIQFTELVKSPLRLFGWVYLLFIGVLLVTGIYFVKNLDSINYNASPQTLNDSLGLYEDKPLIKGGVMPSMDLGLIKNPTDELIAKGKEQYNTLCATCHGTNGDGEGIAGAALNPKPRNFLKMEGWTFGTKFIDLYKTLQEGIIKNGMSAYEYLPPEERTGIIHYVRTFADYPEITDQEVEQIDETYKISSGVTKPNQIPVAKAIKIISEETDDLVNKLNAEDYSNDPGAILLDKYSRAPQNVMLAVIENGVPNTLDEFIKSITSQPESFGLKSSIIRLPREDHEVIYKFLKNINSKYSS
jgi:mono/diheme cytochrome c family protein